MRVSIGSACEIISVFDGKKEVLAEGPSKVLNKEIEVLINQFFYLYDLMDQKIDGEGKFKYEILSFEVR